ncbi:MAG TPA: hypothetical protein V6C81_04920 [Planktothrix sp.]
MEDKSSQTLATELAMKYREINDGFDSPFVVKLTSRGFYSEVNNALNAVVYGLLTQRRLSFDQSEFMKAPHIAPLSPIPRYYLRKRNKLTSFLQRTIDGQSSLSGPLCRPRAANWTDFYTQQLPSLSRSALENIDPNSIIETFRHPGFSEFRTFVFRKHDNQSHINIEQLGIRGNVYQAKRILAAIFCKPREKTIIPPRLGERFAAFQIRRGDKTEGYWVRSQNHSNIYMSPKLMKEGQEIPTISYLNSLIAEMPELKHVFVMTDDYTTVEQLRAEAPQIHFETLNTPADRGYRQKAFDRLSLREKLRSIRQLVSETQIAASSCFFLGGYKSNVARFITLQHQDPGRCYSVDDDREWSPL